MAVHLKGWVEVEGRCLSPEEVADIVVHRREIISRFGGEFLVRWDECCARDSFGVMPGDCPAGTVQCGGTGTEIDPSPPPMDLDRAVREAVRLRSGEGVCALSGGLDSTLIARLAGLPCIAAGMEGSHDLGQARHAAGLMGLTCDYVIISDEMVREALDAVVMAIPGLRALHAGIAVAQYWVCDRAHELGNERVLSGQGADELFGGYKRYLASSSLASDLERDFGALGDQIARDQAVAALHGSYFSLPYLDVRVVRAARSITAEEKVSGGVRKRPLRLVAGRYIPAEIAWKEKKAMQYGSGVWKALERIARHNGYKRSVQRYIDQLAVR